MHKCKQMNTLKWFPFAKHLLIIWICVCVCVGRGWLNGTLVTETNHWVDSFAVICRDWEKNGQRTTWNACLFMSSVCNLSFLSPIYPAFDFLECFWTFLGWWYDSLQEWTGQLSEKLKGRSTGNKKLIFGYGYNFCFKFSQIVVLKEGIATVVLPFIP